MTSPNTIIADMSHEIDRLRRISKLLLDVAIRAEDFVSMLEMTEHEEPKLIGDLRYAIEEAHHG